MRSLVTLVVTASVAGAAFAEGSILDFEKGTLQAIKVAQVTQPPAPILERPTSAEMTKKRETKSLDKPSAVNTNTPRPMSMPQPVMTPKVQMAAPMLSEPQAPVGSEYIDIALGDVHVLREDDVARLAIGNGRIVSATTVSDRQILLIPDAAGQTTLYIWKKNGKELRYTVRVSQPELGKKLLEGSALLSGIPGVTTRVVADRLLVEGVVAGEDNKARLDTLLKQVPDAINLTSRPDTVEPMIYLDVKILEFSKKALDQVGIKWGVSGGASAGVAGPFSGNTTPSGSLFSINPGAPFNGSIPVAPNRIGAFQGYFGIASAITSNLNLFVSNGEAYILAEPKLSCRSGGEAKFLAGGEVPIPVTSGLGGTQITYKEFGVQLNVKPVLNAAGVVSARVRTELSAVDATLAVNGIPGFLTRRTETDVSLKLGESLFLSGLMNDDANNTVEKLPGAGDIPILGTLFRSKLFRQNKTELVIVMTPLLIESQGQLNQEMIKRGLDKRDAVKNPDSPDVLRPGAREGKLFVPFSSEGNADSKRGRVVPETPEENLKNLLQSGQ
jgi:pilus assembly protein CpaC